MTAFKHSYKPKLKSENHLFDIVALAKQALEKKKKHEKIEVNRNSLVEEYVDRENTKKLNHNAKSNSLEQRQKSSDN